MAIHFRLSASRIREIKSFLVVFFISISLSAQDVLESTPPTSLQWQQVNTPHFRVIFPKGFDEQGQRMANTLEHIHHAEARSLGSYPKKISVILQNQSSISNGFVSIMPRRSEFFAMPSQDYNFIGNNDWLNLLASHEYRHIVQYQHATRGFNRLFYYLFGAGTLAGLSQAAVPSWFWEGDAVATETAFTHTGRGKIPNFGLVFRTNLLEGRSFNYHKQYLRSYKHNIPDHYVLGYYMVSNLRKRTNDPEIWSKITARSWSVPFLPFAFSNAIKNKTGRYVTGLYRDMVTDLQKEWRIQIDTLRLTPFNKYVVRKDTIEVTEKDVAKDRMMIVRPDGTSFYVQRRFAKTPAYTDYLYPQPLKDGSVLVMKRGIGDIENFVVLGEKANQVFTPGFINDTGMISAEGSTIVWNEFGYDPRWNIRNYSLIKAYNIDTKQKFVIGGKKSRYANAAISPQENKLVAIETDTDYRTSVVILSFPEGKILKKLDNPQNFFYSMPRWSDDGKAVVCLKTTSEGKAIVVIDAETGAEKPVTTFSDENTGYPVMYKNYIFYNSPVTGIDNIFAIDLSTSKRFQVTVSKYGAYNPSISKDGKTLYYNEQTRDGLDVVYIPFDPSLWRVFTSLRELPPGNEYQHLVTQEGRPGLFDSIPSINLQVKKYSKARGLLNPYSWGAFVNSSLTEATIGITSQDVLSTTRFNAGYVFDIAEQTGAWRASVSYQGLFPIIDVSASLADRSVDEGTIVFRDAQNGNVIVRDELTFEWKEKNLQAGLRVPLITTSSKYAGQVLLSNYIGVTQVSDFKNSINGRGRFIEVAGSNNRYLFRDYVDNGTLIYNNVSVSAYRLLKRSRRDINSKWGQYMSVEHYATPYGGDFNGGLFAVNTILYFPGLLKHHSLWAYGAYQNTKWTNRIDNYIFRNQVPVTRGQSVSRFENFYSTSVNYTLPVCYPDIALGPVVNIQRLRANGFFDYSYGSTQVSGFQQSYTSVGIEAKLDLNLFRFLPQFDLGVRFSKGIDPATTEVEVLIGTFNF